MFFLLTGIVLLAMIIGLFWLKDQLQNPLLARIAYSGLVTRLALVGAAKDAGRLQDAARLLDEMAGKTGNPVFKDAAKLLEEHVQ